MAAPTNLAMSALRHAKFGQFRGFATLTVPTLVTNNEKVARAVTLSSTAPLWFARGSHILSRSCRSRAVDSDRRSLLALFSHPACEQSVSAVGYALFFHQRTFATDGSELDASAIRSRVDKITEKFSEARELLDDAREVKGTVYFSEDMQEATEAVNDTLEDYADLIAQLNEKQKQDVLRTIGLKMEELKAQKNMLEEELED